MYIYVHICNKKNWPKNTCLSPAQPWGIKWTGMSNGDLPHDHLLGWPVYWNMDTEWWKMMKTWVKNMSWLPQLQYIEGSLEVKLPTNFGQYLPLLCRFLIFETSATDVWVASSSRDPKTSGIAGRVLNHIAGIGEKPPKSDFSTLSWCGCPIVNLQLDMVYTKHFGWKWGLSSVVHCWVVVWIPPITTDIYNSHIQS